MLGSKSKWKSLEDDELVEEIKAGPFAIEVDRTGAWAITARGDNDSFDHIAELADGQADSVKEAKAQAVRALRRTLIGCLGKLPEVDKRGRLI